MSPVTAVDEQTFFERISSYLSTDQCNIVRAAFELARREHGDQRRKSGELFFIHPLTIAYYLAEFQLDHQALVAALLHDVAEDTNFSVANIETAFGKDVARLVDGVTKFKEVSTSSENGQRAYSKEDATLHKLLNATTTDVRAVIIKLFDRLHNMRTIEAMPLDRQRVKAIETLSIYAPIANRLGMWELMNELGRRSLAIYDPLGYKQISVLLKDVRHRNKNLFDIVQGQILDCLQAANVTASDILFARENIYTIYRQRQQAGQLNKSVDQRLRIVVLVDEWPACYTAVGHLHRLWKPVTGTFDDYIAIPRDNLYQSLHTTVYHHNGQPIRIRVRTPAMEQVSKIGVLARWLYAGTALWTPEIEERVSSFIGNIGYNINAEPQDPTAGIKGFQDLLRKQIRVYTPKGQTVELAQGATPLDFAYAIHTGLGAQCYAAYVYGDLHPLNKPLQDGAQVQIVKREHERPFRAWLDEDLGYLATNYARSHVRRWFRRLPLERAIQDGKRILRTELTMLGLKSYKHQDIVAYFGLLGKEDLYYQIGRAELLPTVLSTRILEAQWAKSPTRDLDNFVYDGNGERYLIANADSYDLKLCGTCKPRPGDDIAGFLREASAVTVHKESCHLLLRSRQFDRRLKLGWGNDNQRTAHLVRIQVDVYDRPGLLYEITRLMYEQEINIPYIHTQDVEHEGELRLIFDLEITTPRQLVGILHQIRALTNVYRVLCLQDSYTQQDLLAPSLYRPE